MLVPLGVIEDVVPWHMVVDHRHTVVVPNKGSHRCRRPGVSVEIGWKLRLRPFYRALMIYYYVIGETF